MAFLCVMKKMLSTVFLTLIPLIMVSRPALSDTIVIDLKTHVLTYEDEPLSVYKQYKFVGPKPENVSIYGGKPEFTVDTIQYNPSWIDHYNNLVTYASGKSPLGRALIGFKSPNEGPGRPCAIHGNAKENDLGKNLSGCCIRLLDKDILELIPHVTTETVVHMKY